MSREAMRADHDADASLAQNRCLVQCGTTQTTEALSRSILSRTLSMAPRPNSGSLKSRCCDQDTSPFVQVKASFSSVRRLMDHFPSPLELDRLTLVELRAQCAMRRLPFEPKNKKYLVGPSQLHRLAYVRGHRQHYIRGRQPRIHVEVHDDKISSATWAVDHRYFG